MNSIRKRVLFSLLFILTLATVAVGIATYLGIRHEMDELYDTNMRQLAISASGMVDSDETAIKQTPAFSNEAPRNEQVFLIQVWKDGTLLHSSHPAAAFPLQNKQGFGRVFFEEKKWTFYREQINGKIVQVSQRLDERRDVIREVYNAIIIPILIQFPLVSLLAWALVSYGFRPLTRISDLIQKRTADFMQPIPPGQAPDEIRALVTALNDLLLRLEQAFKVQRQFTADAAHELRTPLTAVRLQLDLVNRAKTDEEKREAIAMLDRGVSRSIHLVHQLLELARQQPDCVTQKTGTADLADIARMTADEQKPVAGLKSIALHLDLQAAVVHGDETALAIMAGNILGNAITYTPDGGNVRIHTRMHKDGVLLEVTDDGIGIAPKDRERIFDRFYRVIGTDTPGSGLGLSIVKAIADKHGAKITVSSGPGDKGTVFSVLFPPLSLA